MQRSFTVDSVNRLGKKLRFSGGRYLSESPISAAKKAFSQVCQVKGIKGPCTMKIHIHETTAGSDKKVYAYKVSRISDRREVQRGNELIVYRYTIKVKSIPV
jgi:hypothetical protein